MIFIVIPLGVLVLLAIAVFAPSATRRPRYRPGRPWPYEPVWYLPKPSVRHEAVTTGRRELERRGERDLPSHEDAHPVGGKGGAHGEF